MDKDPSSEGPGAETEGGFSQAEQLRDMPSGAERAEDELAGAPVEPDRADKIRERLANISVDGEPGSVTEPGVEQAGVDTLAERHPDWPRIKMEFFFSPHSTAEDMEGLMQVLQRGDVDIYLYENTKPSDSYQEALQRAANMRRPKFFKRFLKGQKTIDRYVAGMTVGDAPSEPTADKKEVGFLEKWDTRLRFLTGGPAEKQGPTGRPIAGTPLEAEIRAVHDTGAIVGTIDLRPGDPVDPEQLNAEAHSTPITDEGGFEALLVKIEEKYRSVVELQELREQMMPKRLEEKLEEIFEQHPELKNKPDLKIVMSIGAGHAETLPPRFQEIGVETAQTFSQEDENYVYDYQSQSRNELAAGRQPEPETLARAYFEQILGTELNNRGCKDIPRHDSLMRYLRQTAGAFNKDEIAGLYDQNATGELNGAKLDELLEQRGLPRIPSSYAELTEAISGRDAA